MQFYYVIPDSKVDEKHISAKYCKCNSFQAISDLLNSENLKVVFAQLCNELQVCNFTVIADPKVNEKHISTKYSKCNSFQATGDLLNSDNLKVAIALLCNELWVSNLIILQLTQK